MKNEPANGALVAAMVGQVEYRGTVREIYGPDEKLRVVLDLTPEISGYIVDEPTTVVFDLDRLYEVTPA